MNKDSKLKTETLRGIEALRNRLGGWMTVSELDTLFDATLIIKSAFENEQCQYCKHNFDPTDEAIEDAFAKDG